MSLVTENKALKQKIEFLENELVNLSSTLNMFANQIQFRERKISADMKRYVNKCGYLRKECIICGNFFITTKQRYEKESRIKICNNPDCRKKLLNNFVEK